MKKWISSKHDSREIIEKIQTSMSINLDLSKSAQVENFEPEGGARFVIVDEKFVFASNDDGFVPYIGCQPLVDLLPAVRIDDGAVKFIVNGADVMRPGVVSYDDWGDASRLVVIKESKGRGVAVGRTLIKSGEMPAMGKGVCVKNLHHVGDRYWTLYKQI